ncbi:MAG: hypothetical protein GX354_03415 [Firmicutes bacterium]|jgi:hypothetical protein|nr:hypothetical protein [Bacillota bacterium]
MPKKHRRGGVKQQHSIIPGIRKKLQKIATCPHVQAVTPGRISPAVGSEQPVIVFQYFQDTGMKLSGKVPGAVQEIFVVSSNKEAALGWLVTADLVLLEENRSGKAYSQGRKIKPTRSNARPAAEASPDTIQRYMHANNGLLKIPVSERVNGQVRQFRDRLAKQAEKERQGPRPPKSKQPNTPHSQLAQPTTMEEWLKAADEQDAAYWQNVKREKDS